MATSVIATCKSVKAPIDNPKIIISSHVTAAASAGGTLRRRSTTVKRHCEEQ
jgi:hypothetical protein